MILKNFSGRSHTDLIGRGVRFAPFLLNGSKQKVTEKTEL